MAELVARQRTGIECLEVVLARAQQAQSALAAARRDTEQRVSDLAETAGQRDATRTRLDERAASYTRDARAHLRDATELQLPDPATAFAALDAWLEALSGVNPLEQAIAAAGHEAVRRLERQEAAAQARQDESRSSIAELEAECAELERGVHAIPPAPHTRTADARTGRPGAPLWQLTDFRPEIGQDARAGLEAALEASGILDAWVTPTGELLDPHTEDTLLIAVENSGNGARLNEVLVGAADHVERLLGAIGLGESDVPVWVADNGRYRNGALRGAWHKPAARYIGHAAREQARRARLAELREQLDGARAGLAAIEAELTTLAGRREQLERELSGRPSDAEVRHAHATLVAAEGEVAAAARRLAVVRVSEATAADAGDAAQRTLVADAADLGLPHERQPLDEITRALTRFETVIVALWPARDRSVRAERALGQAQDDVRGSEQERDAMAARLAEVERQLAAAIERRETLTETAGAAIEELERRLHKVGEALRANANGQTEAEARVGECQRAEGVADSRHQELIKQLSGATEERLAALDRLRRFASTGLIAVALPELEVPEEWNVTQGLRLAREIEQELAADADEDSRWARLHRQVSDELGQLADALRRHGNGAAMFPREEGIVVEVTFQGRTTTLPDLAHGLAAEVEARQRLLDSREREILENHLVGEVASALQELIVAAEERVRDTNAELAARPTSTGMQLRLRWGANPDAPDGLTDARRRLLRQMADAWSEEDRAAVGGYLQRQIQTVRASDATATWSELLTLAFDYRRWHRFTVERKQAGGWHPAGGPSSGGERVLAASVPLFAAASSYYSSASNPHAPRLVMLDEAFAGVDDRARAKCLGLLAAFDLDVVMTSEREWGCYAEVPGLAIAQLSRIDGVPAVLVTRWEWDGVERTRAGAPPEPALVPAAAPSDERKLWDTSTTSD